MGFGATQGSSTITFNGIQAIPTNWSDTQIVVPVPSGATTGPVIVTVAGQPSNALTFGVGTPPTISASASPAPNAAGWNNGPVTVTFNCNAGSAPIATCPPPQVVLTEGTNLPISATATDTDGTSATTTIRLNIDRTKPVLTIGVLADGSSVSSAAQTVTGSATDSLSGLTSLTCNGTSVPLSGGNFSCNISLSVGVNLIVVRATDLAGNVAGSNFHVSLAGTLPPPQTLTVTPPVANLIVGQTQILTAVDELGRPRDDATFTVSDPTIATISGDPTLTVIAPGPFTVTASVGGVSTSASWNAATGPYPQGTILWSAPTPPPGWAVVQIVQAVPTSNGPDLYSVENTVNSDTLPALTLVRALTSDGRQLWQTQLNGLSSGNTPTMADGNGGIIVDVETETIVNGIIHLDSQLVDLDPQTGSQIWNIDLGFFSDALDELQPAIGPDGTFYSFTGATDGATGATVSSPLASVQVPNSTITYQLVPQNGVTCPSQPQISTKSFPSGITPPTIDADGSLLTLTSQSNVVYTTDCSGRVGSLVQLSASYSLARVRPDGSYTLTPYYTQTNANILPARPAPPFSPYPCREEFDAQGNFLGCGAAGLLVQSVVPTVEPFRPIPDGQGGTLIPARIQDPSTPGAALAHVFHVDSVGMASDIVVPLPAPGVQQTILNTGTRAFDLVLGENNVAFASDGINLASFDFTTGQILWTSTAASPKGLQMGAAISGGGLVVNDIVNGLISFGPTGAPTTTPGVTIPDPVPWTSGHWLGDPPNGALMFMGPNTNLATSRWPTLDGAQKGNLSRRLFTATFVPSIPGLAGSPLATEFGTRKHLADNIPIAKVDNKVHSISIAPPSLATINTFFSENGKPLDAESFLGHAVLARDSSGNTHAVGLVFLDNSLLRTPDCTPSGNLLGVCFDLDVQTPDRPQARPTPPCAAPAVPITSYDGTTVGCYLTVQPNTSGGTQVQQTTQIILSSADIVFVAACDTGQTFTGWWEMNLNARRGGRALVVPDIAAMAALPANQGLNVSPGAVDIQQGVIAWEALAKSLADGNDVVKATKDANEAVAAFYPALVWPPNTKLAQVVFTVIGNQNACPKCK